VSAWAAEHRLVLGQVTTAEHANEIPTSPELLEVLEVLEVLDIQGGTVTIDAIGGQQQITAAIRATRAPYVLRLKGNQNWLYTRVTPCHAAVAAAPERYWRGMPYETHTTVEKDHGRVATRRYPVVSAAAVLHDRTGWTDLATVG